MSDIIPAPPRRRRAVAILLLIFLLTGAGFATWYWRHLQWFESTENAYLMGNLIVVSTQTAGTVLWIGAEENQGVEAGQPLLRLSTQDALQLLELRKQQLALSVQDARALQAQAARAAAELALREITHRLAKDEFDRRQRLFSRKMLSAEELDASRTRSEETAGELQTARHRLNESRIRAGRGPVATQPAVLAAAARLRTSYRAWRKSTIVSPVKGQVARRKVQPGQSVEVGAAIFSIVDRESAWVEANFKESQLRHMRPGQPVAIESDLYGEEFRLSGHVLSIGTGTGSIFSLLPPQNATGNWIKIVQRVPVRIELEQSFDENHPLPFGASLHVSVDTHDRSAARLERDKPPTTVAQTAVYDYQSEGLEQMIDAIVQANGTD